MRVQLQTTTVSSKLKSEGAIIMQQGLKTLSEDDVYQLGMNEAQHNDFNVMAVLMVVSFVLGVLFGVMI